MTLTGEEGSTGIKTFHSVTVSAMNLKWSDLESNPDFRGEGPATV
jgi:hypothetical protein